MLGDQYLRSQTNITHRNARVITTRDHAISLDIRMTAFHNHARSRVIIGRSVADFLKTGVRDSPIHNTLCFIHQ